jgi:hypothetical protein
MLCRPVERDRYQTLFKSSSEEQGRVLHVDETPLEREMGKRQSWHYEVTYSNGDKRQFCVASPGLPVHFDTATEIKEKLKTLKRQPFL